jgi:serine O-acetyltransferase
MIKSKEDYVYYLKCDKLALNQKTNKPRFKHDIIWSFERLLRKCEYYQNYKRGFMGKFLCKYYKYKYTCLSQKLGFSIPFNVFESGLSIAHYGSIIINNHVKVGENCRIHEGVTIGASGDSYWPHLKGLSFEQTRAPIIGNNVFIATGAKILGDITIADGVTIGANAVVVNDILEPNITVGGVPAKKISLNSSDKYVIKATELIKDNV